MATIDTTSTDDELIDVRQAAALVGRNPETIRRWIWSGRLRAGKRGNRYLMRKVDLSAAAGEPSSKLTLAEWAEKAREFRERAIEVNGLQESAANLVIEDRLRRSGELPDPGH